ncbi:hypothetical protein CKO25_11375 [Thiocapsa imhoffii]|uniref:DUF4407 domain-containing protein n=1 Tax=Thiocapsa imhoffii TaxID=382777 RepID=A0A9X1B9P5_9GAMM|nr:hypothetical protein [Thiocapsa imhoffii]MBK1645231.1 hypothetical protein [Thiocapsa imhoffii]
MHLTRFFYVGWIIQLVVGIALFSVSFLIELAVLQSFLAGVVMTLVLAAALELGKATAIVWHRYLKDAPQSLYPVSIRRISAVFRFGLVGLSILCSLLFIGVQVDRPHLEQVRAAELAALQSRLDADLQRVEQDAAAGARRLDARQQEALAALRALHEPGIAELEQLLSAEMDNVVGGVFKGPRYQEIAARLAQAQDQRDIALAALTARQAAEANTQSAALAQAHTQSRQALLHDAERARAALLNDGFETDVRAQHPLVTTFIRTLEAVTGHAITPPLFALGLALFLAVLMELGIVLAFETITLVMLPTLSAQHREEVATAALRAELNGTATREALRHREAIERIRHRADHILNKARMHHDPTATT